MAALVPDVAAVAAHAPFLCDVARALTITDAYPHHELVDDLVVHRDDVEAVHRDDVEAVHRTLAPVDGVGFARRATAPTRSSAALMDDIVPPSTAHAAYAGPQQIDV